MSFRVSISISTLLLPPSNPEPWDGRQMCVSNSTASQAPPGSVGWERHYCNECSFQPVLTGQCFSPYMTKKKCTNFLPSSVPPQEDKSQSFFPFYTKRPPQNPNPPLAFSTSFQSHEKHQLTFPLHQPNQSIQLSIFLTPNKLSSSPASGSPPRQAEECPLQRWVVRPVPWKVRTRTKPKLSQADWQLSCCFAACSVSPPDRDSPHSAPSL